VEGQSDAARPQEEKVTAGGAAAPGFGEACRFWLKLGCISFGGPAGQIALMHAELVEQRRWISDARFLHALNYCMLLPGPEAQQLAIYIGWLLHRTRGGLVAGTLFVLPAAVLLWVLSYIYVEFGSVPWIAAAFYGLKPVVLAIVASAVHRLGRKALKNAALWTIAATAFVAIFFFHVPYPFIVLGAALAGWIGGKMRPGVFAVLPAQIGKDGASTDGEAPPQTRPTFLRALRIVTLGLVVWWTPVFALGRWLGWDHALAREGLFFSKAAAVTFGGAYAVLPYVAQQAVEHFQWLAPGQMLDGLGLAESTPGPLIIVLQFVGFLGAWHEPGTLPPLLAATLGAAITLWTTFVPCFIWIFAGAPHIEQLRESPRLNAALSAITAGVVGVIVNLSVWFGWQIIFPARAAVDPFALTVALIAGYGLVRRNWDTLAVIITGAGLGVLWSTLHRLF
jgi:chromate transporter